MQHIAEDCKALQGIAGHCRTLQDIAGHYKGIDQNLKGILNGNSLESPSDLKDGPLQGIALQVDPLV